MRNLDILAAENGEHVRVLLCGEEQSYVVSCQHFRMPYPVASELLAEVHIEGVQPNQFTYNMAKYFDKVFEPKGIHYKTHRKNKVRLLSFYGDDGDGGDDDIDITQLSGWGIPERPSPSSPSSLGALEESKHGRSVATGQPAEKPTGTAPNPCEAAGA